MIEHLGNGDPLYQEAAAAIVSAIETVLAQGPRTREMGGNASTIEVGVAIAECIAGNRS
jgi:tartrate dehydrogenase/decarboxylase/D-malate dehydrogenase